VADARNRTGARGTSRSAAKRELGRGETIQRGVYRLRLPLPWPGVPHCNAWAVAADDGFVLFDTGMHQPDSLENLERALAMCGLRLEETRLVVCTHAHSDHYGQAATIVQRAGCELWMHPNHGHMTRMAEDPAAVLARRLEVARQSGVPEEPLRRYAEQRRSSPIGTGIAGVIEPDRDLLTGVTIETALGPWTAYETPGHAPSHVCLFQPERRLLISGDHLLGRISLYFDYGHTPDPVGEFLHSLDVVQNLGARLCLAGHGRTFADVHAHIEGNRKLVHERVERLAAGLVDGPLSAFELVPCVYGEEISQQNAQWLLSEILSYLTHMQATGRAQLVPGEPERWTA
jgi:glyoxylase-like metal-dependent hydrolase (beta-lactamase superfamily II)